MEIIFYSKCNVGWNKAIVWQSFFYILPIVVLNLKDRMAAICDIAYVMGCG